MSIFLSVCLIAYYVLLTLQLSGARIKISERGDFMSGTSDRYKKMDVLCCLGGLCTLKFVFTPSWLFCRKVTISGPQSAIRIAETMILRKVAFVTER